jgi:hypothetical protein
MYMAEEVFPRFGRKKCITLMINLYLACSKIYDNKYGNELRLYVITVQMTLFNPCR